MLKRLAILGVFLLFMASCGSAVDFPSDVPTQTDPLVSRIAPNTGKAGDAIIIFGLGFSASAPENIVIIGGAAVSATAYALVTPATATEVESITATVPAGAAIGVDAIEVLVYQNPSNADVIFTVTP